MKIVGGRPSHERKAILTKIIIRTCQQGFFGRGKTRREFRPLRIQSAPIIYGGDAPPGIDDNELWVGYHYDSRIGSIRFVNDKLCMVLDESSEEQYQKALELAKVIDEEIEPIIVINQ
jgi:hypothetical protein